jgi:hypothetical protein
MPIFSTSSRVIWSRAHPSLARFPASHRCRDSGNAGGAKGVVADRRRNAASLARRCSSEIVAGRLDDALPAGGAGRDDTVVIKPDRDWAGRQLFFWRQPSADETLRSQIRASDRRLA